MRWVATVTATVTATALALTPAWAAAEPRAGVLPLDVKGKLPPQGATTLSAEIEAGLRSAGATVVPTADLSQAAGGQSLTSCRDAACLEGVATKASATHLVRPSVRMEESDYVITLELVDAQGKVVHQASETCELCGLTEAQSIARALAASLKEHMVVAAAATGTLTVQSTPAGAEVLVDGEPVGTTPLELQVAAGEHAITLRLPGHVDEERRVVVEGGDTSAVAVELAAAVVDDERPDRSGLLRPIGWASIGVGAAALGSGIALLVLDENPVEYTRCTGIDVDPMGNCRFRHDTLVGGVVMTIVGVAGITAGAILVARTAKGKQADERRARVRPTMRGLAIKF